MINTIIVGDILDVIKSIPDESIDCTITSPPYWGLRNYGTVAWTGGRADCDHKSAKLKTRLDYGSNQDERKGYPQSDVAKYKPICPDCGAIQEDYQLGNEPHFNDYLDKLIELFSEVRRILKPTGSAWVNLGDTYSSTPAGRATNLNAGNSRTSGDMDKSNSGVPKKSQCMIPERFAIRMIDELGYIKRNTIIWNKPNPFPSSVLDRFTNDFEYFFFFTKEYKYYFEQQLEPAKSATLERLKYGLGDGKYNDATIQGHINTLSKPRDARPIRERDYYRNKRCVWNIPTAASEGGKSGNHVAPYPEKLIETPILSCCPLGGTVFDPFMGSGTTAVVAKRLGRNWLGCELNKEYAESAMDRINRIQRGMF